MTTLRMRELKGTEKQIKYAQDIANSFMYLIEEMPTALEKYARTDKAKEIAKEKCEEISQMFNEYENAGDFINDWKQLLYEKEDVHKISLISKILREKKDIGLGRTVGMWQAECSKES